MPAPRIRCRPARPDDAATIAALHAASWRAHYRGSLSDAYLDGPIGAERLAVWTERLSHPRAGQVVLLAEDGETALGFVCAFLDHDRQHGTLIGNLHVTVDRKGSGIGRLLMREAGEAMQHALPRGPVYLFALASNHAARAFYERLGGTLEGEERKTEPDGSSVLAVRYVWP